VYWSIKVGEVFQIENKNKLFYDRIQDLYDIAKIIHYPSNGQLLCKLELIYQKTTTLVQEFKNYFDLKLHLENIHVKTAKQKTTFNKTRRCFSVSRLQTLITNLE